MRMISMNNPSVYNKQPDFRITKNYYNYILQQRTKPLIVMVIIALCTGAPNSAKFRMGGGGCRGTQD